jgi:succinylglutamate desuccinylase
MTKMQAKITINRVLIVGATHPNEWTGLAMIRKFQQQPDIIYRHTLETPTLIANPQGVPLVTRYIDRDLNRCFDRHDLANANLTGYENSRAKEIATTYGSTGTLPVDAILDLHSTTANMGATIIPTSNSIENLRLAAYLQSQDPTAYIYSGLHSGIDSPMLRSLATIGCAIEMGPIAQGVLNAQIFQQAEKLVLAGLDYFEQCNLGQVQLPTTITLFQAIDTIDYPRNQNGEITAMIHPDRQGQDYQPMAPGDALFMDLNGNTITYQGDHTVYPTFINEAAYYEKGIAMVITEKQETTIVSPLT